MLYSSWLFQRIVPPVLSFAMGSLGFLTKFDFGDFESTLTKAFREGVVVSLRLRFEGTVMRSQNRNHKPTKDLVEELIGDESDDHLTHKPDNTFEILNDIVVDRGPNPSKSFPFNLLQLFTDPSSNVCNRSIRRRRTLHDSASRWGLRSHTDRINSL